MSRKRRGWSERKADNGLSGPEAENAKAGSFDLANSVITNQSAFRSGCYVRTAQWLNRDWGDQDHIVISIVLTLSIARPQANTDAGIQMEASTAI